MLRTLRHCARRVLPAVLLVFLAMLSLGPSHGCFGGGREGGQSLVCAAGAEGQAEHACPGCAWARAGATWLPGALEPTPGPLPLTERIPAGLSPARPGHSGRAVSRGPPSS